MRCLKCPKCCCPAMKKVQEARENDIDVIFIDRWGSQGPDCRTSPA